MSDVGDSMGPEDSDDALVAEFVLGLLTADEHAAFARRLTGDARLRRAVQDWRLRFSGLDSEFADQPAPRTAWDRIEGRLFGRVKDVGWWNSLTIWRGFSAAALAVAVVAVGFNIARPALSPQQFAVQLVAALQSQEGSGVEFVAFYDTATGAVKLTGVSGAPVPDKDYELWYIKGSEPAVSMGVIPINDPKQIDLDATARGKIAEGTVLAVTLEQKGGSPTGVAQGPIVALGKALKI